MYQFRGVGEVFFFFCLRLSVSAHSGKISYSMGSSFMGMLK